MLAVTNKDYYMPCYDVVAECWCLNRRRSAETIFTKRCNYTLFINRKTGENERLTFTYDGTSVKPSGRTLRIFGAKNSSWYTSRAANNHEMYLDLVRNDNNQLSFICDNNAQLS
jgi:hypothetical protein